MSMTVKGDRRNEVIWQAIIAAIVTIALAGMNLYSARLAAGKVETVRTELKTTTAATDVKLEEIHVLVNSNLQVQLQARMELSQWKADQTKLPADIEAA